MCGLGGGAVPRPWWQGTGASVGGVRWAALVLPGAHGAGSRLPLFPACCGGADQQRAIDGVLSTFQASVIFVDSV